MANKVVKLACLSLLSLVALTSCSSDEIVAKPTNYEDNLVIGGTTEKPTLKDVYNNIEKIIADAYHDGGSFQSDTLTKVLYVYAKSVLGEYNKVTAGNATGTTLKEAAKDASNTGSDHAIVDKFVDDHKAYQYVDDKGNRNREVERARVVAKWETIDERIAEAMYSKISGGSYSDRNYFSERKFVRSLFIDLKKVDYKDSYEDSKFFEDKLLTPDIEPEEVFKKELLHREYYQHNAALDKDETVYEGEETYVSYVEDEVLPSIYSNLLVEQYIFDQSYNVLGRSNARKINIISVSADTNHIKLAKNFIESIRDRIFTTYYDDSKTGNPAFELADFKNYSKVWNGVTSEIVSTVKVHGIDGETNLEAIADSVFGAKTLEKNYYVGSAYGKVMEDYSKITTNPYTNDTSIESSFTNSGAYTKEVGLKIKEDEIKLKDHTTNGWFIKSNGVSSLPDSISSRLFNLAVATSIPEGGSVDQNALDRANKESGKITYTVKETEGRYVARVNGKYYLKTSTQAQGSSDKDDIIFFDNSSSTYYIIQIEEAANVAKFSVGSQTGYSTERLAEIENDIVEVVAGTESYQTLAKKYWVEQMDIADQGKYHDQSIYDYFKENYPDIFD